MYSKILYPSGYKKSLKSNEYFDLYPSLFIRKICGKTPLYKKACQNEIIIAKKLIKYKFKNIVNIYKITDEYIDYELLDTNKKIIDVKSFFNDIKNGLDELNNLGIIYIDLKLDNIGFSDRDKCWKIFDFDCSGIINPDKKTWKIKPIRSYILDKLKKNEVNIKNYNKVIYNNFIKNIDSN